MAWAVLYVMTSVSLISLAWILLRLATRSLQPRRLLWNQLWMLSTWIILIVATCWPLLAQVKDDLGIDARRTPKIQDCSPGSGSIPYSRHESRSHRNMMLTAAAIGHMLT